MSPSDSPAQLSADDRSCPLCGETIKKVAIRCKHCHGDLSNVPLADFDRAIAKPSATSSDAADFERRFLEFAYATKEPITVLSVAHALKIPIADADEHLESLAVNDVILRDVDDDGGTFFTLPGKKAGALVKRAGQDKLAVQPPPSEAAATAGLVLNVFMPGVGSLVAGKTSAGVAQLALVTMSLPVLFIFTVILGAPLMSVFIAFPMIFAGWVWGLVTSGNALREARTAAAIDVTPVKPPATM